MTSEELAKYIHLLLEDDDTYSEIGVAVVGKSIFVTHYESGREFIVSVVEMFPGLDEAITTGKEKK